jgi:hypothetical protein
MEAATPIRKDTGFDFMQRKRRTFRGKSWNAKD